jgi:hypothetical protein
MDSLILYRLNSYNKASILTFDLVSEDVYTCQHNVASMSYLYYFLVETKMKQNRVNCFEKQQSVLHLQFHILNTSGLPSYPAMCCICLALHQLIRDLYVSISRLYLWYEFLVCHSNPSLHLFLFLSLYFVEELLVLLFLR